MTPRTASNLSERMKRRAEVKRARTTKKTASTNGAMALESSAAMYLADSRLETYPGPEDVRRGLADLAADLWQGPVPDDPRHDVRQLAHYDWHWFWHWGNGELGNNGIHFLDILRWGLKAEHPLRVSYTGGRYAFANQPTIAQWNLARLAETLDRGEARGAGPDHAPRQAVSGGW